MNLSGTRTRRNLMKAFEGESKAAMKYFHFADEADEHLVEEIFLETMRNEQEHAEEFAEYLGLIGDTMDNLRSCVSNESLEAKIDYPEFARIAREEGFEDIAALFERVAQIELRHRNRFQDILYLLETKALYNRSKKQIWECMKCGHIHEGFEAPEECPVCGHSRTHFKIHSNIY